MRRIPIQIRTKKIPDQNVGGHLVVDELRNTGLTFFSSKKLNPDEQIEISGEFDGKSHTYSAQLLSCHEPMSSGKILSSVPVDGQPLPSRVFFRCIAKFEVAKSETESQNDSPEVATEPPVAA